MLRHRLPLLASVVLVAVLLLPSPWMALAQQRAVPNMHPAKKERPMQRPGTVKNVKAIGKPKTYNGPCPATIQFVGTIFVTRPPVTVEYQWERSDGATGQRQKLEIRSAGEGVYDTWQLGEPRQRMHIWERLHVLSPRNAMSNRAGVTVNCRK